MKKGKKPTTEDLKKFRKLYREIEKIIEPLSKGEINV